ncbi:MAG: c-type cytochrome [Pseudomonadales bacterium]|jgi:putative heme-binding domain-containing protein|nr:c-type cytochrome [Pseudomonadales bacterium]
MNSAITRVFAFLLICLGIYLWIGYTITELTGGEKTASAAVEITPEGGETIFWGKGRCYTCHSMGGQGSAVRCPNLGQFGERFELPIGARAELRAKERSEETGRHYTATDYLVESLAKPDAYIVEGYKNEMAIVYAPPISLNLDEIQAVLMYLLSQGGELDMVVFEEPSEVTSEYFDRILAATAAGGGDPGNGEIVFEDYCQECHAIGGDGGEVGPDLSSISVKGKQFISDSVTAPTGDITEGYETFEVVQHDGRRIAGIKKKDDVSGIDIMRETGELVEIGRADIDEVVQDESRSLMPDDLTEALTIKDFQDVQAFLMMQKQEVVEEE